MDFIRRKWRWNENILRKEGGIVCREGTTSRRQKAMIRTNADNNGGGPFVMLKLLNYSNA